MARARPALLDPEVTLALDPARAHALLSALRAPAGVVRACADPSELARLLFVSPLPAALSAALHRVVALASERGHWALVEAAADVGGIDASGWEAERALDLAATVVQMAARGDTAAERCVERALVRLARLLPDRVGHELVARRPPPPIDEAALADALATLPAAEGTPWIALDDDGTVHAAVRWRGVGDRAGRVFFDRVAIEPATGRVSVESARPDRVLALARALAVPVFGEAHPFLERPALTLKPVVAAGAAGILRVALPAPVKSVTVVACQLVTKGGERFEARSEDALAYVADLMASRGGYAGRATFRFVIDGAPAPVDAYVELPNMLGLRETRFRREVRAALAALGVFSPGATADDVATLAYTAEPEWRWREVLGAEGVLRMRALGLLVAEDPARTRGVSTERDRASGHSLRTFELHHPIDRGRRYAFADDWTVRARSVGDEERAMLRLDVARLGATLRADLGLAEPPTGELPPGVIDLGLTAGEQASYRVFDVIAALAGEPERRRLAKALAKAALPAHAVVLVPRGRRLDHSLEVELDLAEQLGLASVRAKLAGAIGEIRRAPQALHAARAAERVVRISITGARAKLRTIVLIDGAAHGLPDRSFALLVLLAAAQLVAPGSWTERRALGIHLTRHTPSRLSTLLRAALPTLPSGFVLVESDRRCCRLGAHVIVEGIDWEALRDHPEERVRKLARAQGRRA